MQLNNHYTIFGVPYLDKHAVQLRSQTQAADFDTWLQTWAHWLQTNHMADWLSFNLFYRTNNVLCDELLVSLWGFQATVDFTARLQGLRPQPYPRAWYIRQFMWQAWRRRGLLLFSDVIYYALCLRSLKII